MSAIEGKIDYLTPEWSAPRRVRAAFSLRAGGVSKGSYAALNLGIHVGDDIAKVKENCQRLRAALSLPAEPRWLNQVHGIEVHHARAQQDLAHQTVAQQRAAHAGESSLEFATEARPIADAAVTGDQSVVLAIQVADCLPILLASGEGRVIAAAHAGWRGLAQGVIESTLGAMQRIDPDLAPQAIHAWLGPCIGLEQFEIGAEVREIFLESGDPEQAFVVNARGRWQADLIALARHRLQRAGVVAITGGQWCTASEPERFFSHRRDSRQGGQSGRMAALLWLQDPA